VTLAVARTIDRRGWLARFVSRVAWWLTRRERREAEERRRWRALVRSRPTSHVSGFVYVTIPGMRQSPLRVLVHRPAHQVVPHPDDPGEPGRAAGLVPAGVSDLDDLADVNRDAASRDDELVPGVDQDRG